MSVTSCEHRHCHWQCIYEWNKFDSRHVITLIVASTGKSLATVIFSLLLFVRAIVSTSQRKKGKGRNLCGRTVQYKKRSRTLPTGNFRTCCLAGAFPTTVSTNKVGRTNRQPGQIVMSSLEVRTHSSSSWKNENRQRGFKQC